ncbi:FAD:protein FMN transferase [Phytohabitans aurantiacus]|uniref:FAD:protein FMN transferase n=1 Tax=Phytohabitans aurantiacus TaxID=3016789 RepID=A0ABQ5R4Z2_9ACTN|nr:FAD:protein FMN transferase [Phytohabitans aurantiacus]GLI01252.1 FAD:protein FMN transferase [Phytohabitans aurantiacus]
MDDLRVAVTDLRVAVTDPSALRAARKLAQARISEARVALGRELSRVHLAPGRPVRLSPVLADLVEAALDAAKRTGGDVDPTVGTALLRQRYGQRRPWLPACGSVLSAPAAPVPGWRRVRLDEGQLTLPPGVVLDLGATAPARIAERCAEQIAVRYGVGALVALGGDVATAGPAPAGGWRDGAITLPHGGAIGTSSAQVLDPRTGAPATRVWRRVTVVAQSCLTATALATAAQVRGEDARHWLAALPVQAHLDPLGGTRANAA